MQRESSHARRSSCLRDREYFGEGKRGREECRISPEFLLGNWVDGGIPQIENTGEKSRMVGRGKGRGQEREPFSFLGVGFMVPMRHLRKERCLPGYRSTKAGPGWFSPTHQHETLNIITTQDQARQTTNARWRPACSQINVWNRISGQCPRPMFDVPSTEIS